MTGVQTCALPISAGYIGPKYKVEHDISLMMPELWSRLSPEERDPAFLKAGGYLEQVKDFVYQGRSIPASRLGWRITPLFAATYLGRIFDTPAAVFTEDMLRPELQSLPDFVDGIENIAQAMERSAKAYIEDGSIEAAIPPLKALLWVMATGSYEGRSIHDPELRRLFDRDYVLGSDWYAQRLSAYQEREVSYLKRSVDFLRQFLEDETEDSRSAAAQASRELARAEQRLERLVKGDYAKVLFGSIGKDPLYKGAPAV